jgi:hypothetical protein
MLVPAPVLLVAAMLQGPPATDVFVADLTITGGAVTVSAPRNVTRRAGYDNQPAFLPDGRSFLYTCILDGAQADICRYDGARDTTVRLTRTPESEYSPTPTPDGGFAVVRVERDSTQRVWRFDATASRATILIDAVKPVGYFAFADDQLLGLFVLGEPPTFQVVDLRGARDTVAINIGRTIRPVPPPQRRALSFVQRRSEAEWWITIWDAGSRTITPVARTLEGVDFYTWLPNGDLLAGKGSKLFHWTTHRADWTEVADLAAAGLTSITRLTTNAAGDRLAIVAIPTP